MTNKKNKRKRIQLFQRNTENEISLVCSQPKSSKEAAVKPAGTFCSLVNSFCKSQACLQCSVLENKVPRHVWLCNVCADSSRYVLYPFWEDTPCEKCGIDVGVMICSKKRKKRR